MKETKNKKKRGHKNKQKQQQQQTNKQTNKQTTTTTCVGWGKKRRKVEKVSGARFRRFLRGSRAGPRARARAETSRASARPSARTVGLQSRTSGGAKGVDRRPRGRLPSPGRGHRGHSGLPRKLRSHHRCAVPCPLLSRRATTRSAVCPRPLHRPVRAPSSLLDHFLCEKGATNG